MNLSLLDDLIDNLDGLRSLATRSAAVPWPPPGEDSIPMEYLLKVRDELREMKASVDDEIEMRRQKALKAHLITNAFDSREHPRFMPAAVRLFVKEFPPLQQHLIDWQNYGEEGALRLVYSRDILGSDYEETYQGVVTLLENEERAIAGLEARRAREEASPPDEDPGNPFEHGGEG